LDVKKLIAPDYFTNNITWVLNGQITNQTFLTSYHSFVNQGIIHPPITEPEPIITHWWWVKKPSGIIVRTKMSDSSKRKAESIGWVFSLTKPEPDAPEPDEPEPDEPEPDKPEPDEPEPVALLSANVKISFTDFNIGGFSSSIPIDDIGELQILSNSAPEWKYTLIDSSTNQPISSLSELINNINDLLASIEPEPEPTITDNMVTQQVINFNIVNGRAVGSIKFVATNNFNPYFYGHNIVNIVKFKDPNGVNILTFVKENPLNFTETERDEVISYDEDMQGNTRATVESHVWSSATQPTPFSKTYSIEISEAEPPKPVTTGFMSAGIAGAIAGLVLIGFIADHKRGK